VYVCRHFKIYELVPEYIYRSFHSRSWVLFDERILKTIDRLRERYGTLVVNTWYWRGNSQYRGWRPQDCKVGAKFSQHKFGRAIDLIPKYVTASGIREDIKCDPFHKDFEYITCVEDNTYHLHIDCRNYDKNKYGLLVIKL